MPQRQSGIADHHLPPPGEMGQSKQQPAMRIVCIKYSAIEQPAGRAYSSRRIKAVAELPPGACPIQAVDLLDQALSARLGVRPMRQELAEKAVRTLEYAKEEADRAASRLPLYVVEVEKKRIQLRGLSRELEQARAQLDAIQLTASETGDRVAKRQSRATKIALARLSEQVQGASDRVADLQRRHSNAEGHLKTYEQELASIELKAGKAPHPTAIEEARALLQSVIADLQRNKPALPL